MDAILYNPKTNVVDNVICADSVEAAQECYSDHACIERTFPCGPGWISSDGKEFSPPPADS